MICACTGSKVVFEKRILTAIRFSIKKEAKEPHYQETSWKPTLECGYKVGVRGIMATIKVHITTGQMAELVMAPG